MNYFRHDCQVATDILSTRQRPPTEHNLVLFLCLWYSSIGPVAAGKSTAILGDILETLGYVSRDISLCYLQYIIKYLHRGTLCIYFFQHSFQSYKFFLVFLFRCYLHYLISTSPLIAFLCKSGIWRNSDKEMCFVFLFLIASLRLCACACSRTNCVSFLKGNQLRIAHTGWGQVDLSEGNKRTREPQILENDYSFICEFSYWL
jgi:hypothetical protein